MTSYVLTFFRYSRILSSAVRVNAPLVNEGYYETRSHTFLPLQHRYFRVRCLCLCRHHFLFNLAARCSSGSGGGGLGRLSMAKRRSASSSNPNPISGLTQRRPRSGSVLQTGFAALHSTRQPLRLSRLCECPDRGTLTYCYPASGFWFE